MPVRIEKIDIKNFRHFHNLILEFPKPITLIGGTNGTSKSTLLGMLGQPLGFDTRNKSSSYTDNYNEIGLHTFKTVAGKQFATKYSEVFRMSRRYDNPSKNCPYKYEVYLSGDCIGAYKNIKDKGLVVRSIPRESTTSEIRFVTGPGHSQGKGEGNFPHPVIYLGLDRLSPLALCDSVDLSKKNDLSPNEKSYLSNRYTDILTIMDKYLQPQFVHLKTNPKGDFYGPQSSDFDAESCSAGQDNLGQILSSVISFQRLKAKLGDSYQGGLLLIDEIDATLHPVAQDKLLRTLLKVARDLDLQIIATTHSLYLFRRVFQSDLKRGVGAIFLECRSNRNIAIKTFSEYDEIENWLNFLSGTKKNPRKISLLREDASTWDFFRSIVGPSICKYLKENKSSLSASVVGHLSSINCPEVQNIIFLVDGDEAGQNEVNKKRKNLLKMPGDTYPEKLLYDFIKNLDDDDAFFAENRKEVFFNEHMEPHDPQDYKNWYQENKKDFGPNCRKAFRRWIEDNKPLAKEFCTKFNNILDRVANAKCVDIPQVVFNKLKARHD